MNVLCIGWGVAKPGKLDIDPRALGYVRLSKEEGPGNGGLGLEAQRSAIQAEVERRGWVLVDVIEDVGFSGRNMRRLHGLPAVLPLPGTFRGLRFGWECVLRAEQCV